MKTFDRITAAVIALVVTLIAAVNIYFALPERNGGRQYRVDAARAAAAMESGEEVDTDDYPTLTAIVPAETEEELCGGGSDYMIKSVGGKLYRFEYSAEEKQSPAGAVNIALFAMGAVLAAALLIIRKVVIKPFFSLREVPYELSRGNLSAQINENRHKLFGRFTWGLNMLRDNLEQQKKHELELQAEKKKLIISLSHDIKIPLSAIKLYAKALEKGMYDPGKQTEAAAKINERADEIEKYVSEIVKASNEDFLALTVENGEFYLSGLIENIRRVYSDKCVPLGVGFTIEKYDDCLLRGDPDRAAEVLGNIIENALKYGDGKNITVSFSDEEDCRLISVRNSGCTLPADELPHIFDSFYRGSNAADKGGSGLGLYICRTLMRKMNGDIFAKTDGGDMTVTAVFVKSC